MAIKLLFVGVILACWVGMAVLYSKSVRQARQQLRELDDQAAQFEKVMYAFFRAENEAWERLLNGEDDRMGPALEKLETLDDYLAENLKDPEFKAAWDALESEFQAKRKALEKGE